MTERPISFSADMIEAIHGDRKSQTRRVIKPQAMGEFKYGVIGDRLIVSEDITLEITAEERVERLQDISRDDAMAEGISVLPLQSADDQSAWWQSAPGIHQERSPIASFRRLWDSIYGVDGPDGWAANPWVRVVTFARVASPPHTAPCEPPRWRPIAEMTAEHGPCLVVDIRAPDLFMFASFTDANFAKMADRYNWTHFQRILLDAAEAEMLKKEMNK